VGLVARGEAGAEVRALAAVFVFDDLLGVLGAEGVVAVEGRAFLGG